MSSRRCLRRCQKCRRLRMPNLSIRKLASQMLVTSPPPRPPLVQTREAPRCLRSCKNGRASCVKCKSTRACNTCAKGFRVGSAGSCGKIPPPPYRCVPVSCTAQPPLSTRGLAQLRVASARLEVAGHAALLRSTWCALLCTNSLCAHHRCKAGKANCRKCKSTKACKTCATGFKVGPKGSCAVIPKPPPYKCAAEGLVALSPCLILFATYRQRLRCSTNVV